MILWFYEVLRVYGFTASAINFDKSVDEGRGGGGLRLLWKHAAPTLPGRPIYGVPAPPSHNTQTEAGAWGDRAYRKHLQALTGLGTWGPSPVPPVDPFLRSPWCCDVGPARPRPRWGDGEMGPPPLPSPTSAFCNGRKIPFPPGRAPRSRRFGLPSFLGHVACLLTLSRACSSAPRGLWNSAVPRKISSPGILHYWSPEETHDFY